MRSSDKRKGKKTSPLREVFSFEGGTALIERIKYRFGTTRSGRRVHILYSLARNPYTTLCRAYGNQVQDDKSLTINDVDCKRCRRTLTYFRLLPGAQFKDIEARLQGPVGSANDPKAMHPEHRTTAPAEPAEKFASFGEKPRPRPRLMFDAGKEIRCLFLTLVVRVESLKKKYRKGIGNFLERYGARCNRDLACICTMGGEDLDEPVMDLRVSGLAFGEDFVCFDASRQLLGIEMVKKFDKNVSEEIRFPIEWLRGRVHNGGVLLSLVEKTQEARKQ